MQIFYWNKIKTLNIKYTCKIKIPLLIEELLFDFTYINERNYLNNYNKFKKIIKENQSYNFYTRKLDYEVFNISYVISNKHTYHDKDENKSLYNLDQNILSFIFSLNHKKIIYSKHNIDIDTKKKIRQYVHLNKHKSIFLCKTHLYLECENIKCKKLITTKDPFLDEVIQILNKSKVSILNGHEYRQFIEIKHVINNVLKEEPYLREKCYLYYLNEFIRSMNS